MTITFYQLPGSAPCRSVALTAAALGVEMNFKEVALMNGEHMKPEFIKMNPQHTIPTIDDNGFYLWESRAIMAYLAEQYGKNDSLYPKDPKKRAIVNQRLYFDACTLYKAFADYYYPIIFAKGPKDEAKYESLGTALSFLDKFLEGQDYVAGKNMTLADLAIVASISTIEGEQILFDERNGRVAVKCGCNEEKNGKIVDNGNMNNRAGGGGGCLSDGKMTIGDRKEMLREIVSRGGGLTAIPCTATFIRYVICLQQVMDYDLSKYKNVTRWYAKIKSEAPKYEQCNGAGAKAFKALVDELKKK